MQIDSYLVPPGKSPPLDWHDFPHIIGDISVTQMATVGSPMYDPSGMLVALLALSRAPVERSAIADKLEAQVPLMEEIKVLFSYHPGCRELGTL